MIRRIVRGAQWLLVLVAAPCLVGKGQGIGGGGGGFARRAEAIKRSLLATAVFAMAGASAIEISQ
jgi:hypothetical protein